MRIRRRVTGIGGRRRGDRGGHGSQRGRQFGILVTRRAHISLHAILLDVIDNYLYGLRVALAVNPDRFVEINFFLGELIVVHHHGEVEVLVLGVGPAERKHDGADAAELFGFCEVEFEIAALAALGQ